MVPKSELQEIDRMTPSARMDLSFCPTLAAMIAAGRSIDADGATIIPTGTSTVNNLVVLNNLCRALKVSSTLEVGFAYGASALVFGQWYKDSGAAAVRQHLAIDPFQDHLRGAGVAAMERAGLSGFVQHLATFSDRALPELLAEGRQFDMIYVDGSHLFEDVFIDCHYSTQLVAEGGVIAFDDCSDAHVAKAIRFARRNMRHILEEIDLSPFRADGGKSARYRAAKVLNRAQLTAFRKIGSARRPYTERLSPF